MNVRCAEGTNKSIQEIDRHPSPSPTNLVITWLQPHNSARLQYLDAKGTPNQIRNSTSEPDLGSVGQ